MDQQQPGWHPDPGGTHQHRYWDGSRWTDDVADSGVTSTDPLPSAASATDPTSAMPTAVTSASGGAPFDPAGPAGGPAGPLTAEAGAKRGLVIGLVALVAVALLVGGFFLFGGDDSDGDGDLASEVGEDTPTTTAPEDLDGSDLGDLDDFDLDDFGDFDDFGFELPDFDDLDLDDLDALGLGGLGLGTGDFDPADPVGSTARIYESLFGLSAAQSRCLAETMFDLFGDVDDPSSSDAMSGVFGAFDRCNISMSDMGGFDPGG